MSTRLWLISPEIVHNEPSRLSFFMTRILVLKLLGSDAGLLKVDEVPKFGLTRILNELNIPVFR